MQYSNIKKLGVSAIALAGIYVLAVVLAALYTYSDYKSFATGTLRLDVRTAHLLAWSAMLLFTSGGLVATARILLFGSKSPVLYISAVLPLLISYGLNLYFAKPVGLDGTNLLCCNKRPKRELFCQQIEKNEICGFDPITQDRMRPSTKKERLLWYERRRGSSAPIIIPLPSLFKNLAPSNLSLMKPGQLCGTSSEMIILICSTRKTYIPRMAFP